MNATEENSEGQRLSQGKEEIGIVREESEDDSEFDRNKHCCYKLHLLTHPIKLKCNHKICKECRNKLLHQKLMEK